MFRHNKVYRVLISFLITTFILPNILFSWKIGAYCFAGTVSAAKSGKSVAIPKETTFLVEFIDEVSSRDRKEGSKVHLETREDVAVQNVIVIPYGTRFTATVSKIKKPGLFGRGGSIDLDFGSINAIDQTSVPLEIGKIAAGKNKDSGIIVPLAALIIFLPLVLFGMEKGEQGKIYTGTQMYINTKEDTTLSSLTELKKLERELLSKRKGPKIHPGIVELSIIKESSSEENNKPSNENKTSDVIMENVKSITAKGITKPIAQSTTLMAKWYYKGNLTFARSVTIPRDETKFKTEMVPANGKSFPKGDWRVEIEYNNEALKNATFKVVEEE